MRARLALVATVAIGIGFALTYSARHRPPDNKSSSEPSETPSTKPIQSPDASRDTTSPPAPDAVKAQTTTDAATQLPAPPSPNAAVPSPPTPSPNGPLPIIDSPRTAARPTATTSTTDAALESDLLQVQLMVRGFRDVVGENPTGTNAEIMAAILGDNSKQAKIGPPENQHLNEKGELVDRWGTPYFFHQLSKTQMEIRSAGPDRIMWTGDDKQL